METGEVYTGENNGNYFIPLLPAGTYTLQVSKAGYTTQMLPGIVVATGSITEQDVELAAALTTGQVRGIVSLAGVPVAGAIVSIIGFPLLTTTTTPAGEYVLSNVPAGPQVVRAELAPPHRQCRRHRILPWWQVAKWRWILGFRTHPF